jgi:hypothetical protein
MAIQVRLMTPSANSATISPQQQPTQYETVLGTHPQGSRLAVAPTASTKWSGPRQWRRQTSFRGVSSYSPAKTSAPPAT